MLLQVERASVSLSGEPLFTDLSFTVHRGDRIGLVGVNGCGKTTLLRIIAGHLRPDAGRVSLSRGVRVAYLGPWPVAGNGVDGTSNGPGATNGGAAEATSLGTYLLQPLQHLVDMEQRLKRLSQQLASATPEQAERLLEAYGQLEAEFDRQGGYTLHQRVVEVAAGLGLLRSGRPDGAAERELARPLASLSAGERARAALARLLLDDPDVLLLDEPTNHLDIETQDVLIEALKAYAGTLVFVTHDRHLVRALAARRLELGPSG